MLLRSIAVGPEYCSFYVAGTCDVDVPFLDEGAGFAATRECITVGCVYCNDSDTMITIGPDGAFAGRPAAVFEWMLDTREGEIVIFDAVYPEILSVSVTTSKTLLRFWTNHVDQPNKVAIAIVAGAGIHLAMPLHRCRSRRPRVLPPMALPLQDNGS